MTRSVGGRLLHGELTDRIIRAYYDVFDALAYGVPESAFQRAMDAELHEQGLTCNREVELAVHYKGRLVGQYRADLIVENKVIVEIKAAPRILRAHEAQLIGYLKISKLQVGILLNFGPEPEFKRFFLNSRTESPQSPLKSKKSEGS